MSVDVRWALRAWLRLVDRGSLSGRQLGIEAAPQRCTTAMKKYAFVGLAEAQQITDLTRRQTLDISQADHEPLALR